MQKTFSKRTSFTGREIKANIISFLSVSFAASAIAMSAVFLLSCSGKKEDRPGPPVSQAKDSSVSALTGQEKASAAPYEITKSLPPAVSSNVKGKVVATLSFTDKLGENFIIVEEREGTTGSTGKELYASHFAGKDSLTRLWQIRDFVKECELDLRLEYIAGSLTETDLDSNGVSETSFLYRMSCKGDVSPDDMKLIMHQGSAKFAIRGTMDLDISGQGIQKGEMNIDPSFNKAPSLFREFAVAQWNKFKTDRLGY